MGLIVFFRLSSPPRPLLHIFDNRLGLIHISVCDRCLALYDTAKMHIAAFENGSKYDKFLLILGGQSAPVLVALGNFLYTCFRKRNTWQVVYMSSK